MNLIQYEITNSRTSNRGTIEEVFLLIRVTFGLTDEVVRQLLNVESVVEVHKVKGPYDLIVKLNSDQLDGVRETLNNKIRTIHGVKQITALINNTHTTF